MKYDSNLLYINRIPKLTHYFKPHAHPYWEIVLYTHGTGETTVGQVTTKFKPGTIICMPPNLLQEEKSDSGYRNIHLLIKHFDAWESAPVIHTETGHPIYKIAELLCDAFLFSGGKDVLVNHLFGAFMQYLYSWQTSDIHDADIKGLQKAIIDNLHNPEFSVIELLDSLNLSLDHTRRLFIKKTGQTPMQFLIAARMIKAKELLIQGKSAKETAISVGLIDPAYFSRIFTKTHGLSPITFKRAINSK
ncbi:MAG: AraC family transcriptional regulator [Fibrobacteres bacterium]|nr:AraC family transcriptional regulator [Fibrobacterota bacterium]